MLVCAHTSAGKTVAAEHAIATALRDRQRVFYASPIKALSNQKYRQLQAEFEDVGLLTGDVTLNEDASCLVVTTEVLRVMLYRGATAMREVSWVIFDEVHMLGAPDRGWVIEETLILLPSSVRVVLLSATMPNALEVAEWIASLHGQPVHVVSTAYRPTPLRHYVCPLHGAGLHLVCDEQGRFDEAEWHSAVGGLPRPRAKTDNGKAAATPAVASAAADAPSAKAMKHANEVVRVLHRLGPLEMLPAIVFCFSRRECEVIAMQMGEAARKATAMAAAPATVQPGRSSAGNADLTIPSAADADVLPWIRNIQPQLLSAAETAAVQEIYEGAIGILSDEDAAMPQVKLLLPLLRVGVGLHHSGLLPCLRELVELLFAEGLLKVLIATETLAMGLNLPARTVVFSGPHKFDGEGLRLMRPTEYTQMAGRAGRRGLDTQGFAILLISQWISADEGEEILSRRYAALESQFVLRFSTLLKLMRTEGAGPHIVLARNLRAWQAQRAQRSRREQMKASERELAVLDAELIGAETLHAQADSYLQLRADVYRLGRSFERRVRAFSKPWLQPGRVVRLYGDRGWAVVLSVLGGSNAGHGERLAINGGEDGKRVASAMSAAGASDTVLAVLAYKESGGRKRRAEGVDDLLDSGDASDIDGAGTLAAVVKEVRAAASADVNKGSLSSPSASTMSVIAVRLDDVQQLSSARLWMPRVLDQPDAQASIALSLEAAMAKFGGSMPLLDPIEDMHIDDELLRSLIAQLEAREDAMFAHPLYGKPELQAAYTRCRRRRFLVQQLARLRAATEGNEGGGGHDELGKWNGGERSEGGDGDVSDTSISIGVEADSRLIRMRRTLCTLGYITAGGVLQLKGRAACCIEGADELLATEALVQGVFESLSISETAAALTCLLPDAAKQNTPDGESAPLPTPGLEAGIGILRNVAKRLETVVGPFASCSSGVDGRGMAVSVTLVPAVLAWAGGASFEASLRSSPTFFEGTLVRCLRSLDELLRQMGQAAHVLGDTRLQQRFADCGTRIHRGVPFAASLYLQD